MTDTLQSSLQNCLRVCLVFEIDKVRPSNSLFTHGGIEGTVKVFPVSDGRTFKTVDTTIAGAKDPLLTFRVSCQNRTKGDLQVQVLDAKNEEIASFSRLERPNVFKKTDKTISVVLEKETKQPFATIVQGMTGKKAQIECHNGSIFAAHMPAWQAQTQWLCCAFLCFLPTFGVASLVGFCMACRSVLVTKIQKRITGDNNTTKQSLPDAQSKENMTLVRLDTLSEWKDKLALLLLFGFLQAHELTEPPQSHTSHAGGGPM